MTGYVLSALITGLGIWLVAGLFLYSGMEMRGGAAARRKTESRWAADIPDAAPGTVVEANGTVRCETPLISEMGGFECAYYLSEVRREYREGRQNSQKEWEVVTRSEVVISSERYTDFAIEDGSGIVGVVSEGVEVQGYEMAVNRFEKVDKLKKELEIKSATLGGSTVELVSEEENTIGYRYSERVLLTDAAVYVVGAVSDDGRIAAPEDGKVLISYIPAERHAQISGKMGRGSIVTGVLIFLFGLPFVGVGVYGLISL